MADIASILVDGQNPSMPALRAWLQNLSASVGALAGGFRTFSSLAELNAYVPSETDAMYAFVINGEVFQGHRYDAAWVADDTFFKGLSAAAQESIDVIERKVDANTALISPAVLTDLLVNGTPQSYGTLAPTIANFVGAQSVGNNTPIIDPGVLARVRIKASGAAAGFLDVLTPVSGGFALRAFPITLAGGENIITTAVLGYLPMIAGSLVGWRQVSGAGILYANDAGGVGGVFVFPQSEAGDPVVTPDYSTSYSVALSFDVVAAPSMSALLAALSGSGGQTVIGSIAPTTGNWEPNQSVSSITAVVVPSILQELQIRVSAASTGFLDAVDGSGKILQSVPTSLSAGLNTLTGGSLPQTTIPVGGRVFYRALTGGTLVYDTTTGANGVAVYFNNDAPDGQTSIIKATGFFVALKFTYKTYAVSILARLDSIDARLNGANDGDTKALRADPSFVIDQQVYRGSALPANHGVTGSWSNTSSGQAITTGGGWSTFFYTGGYSNADRRAVSYVIKVNDAASVFGIAAQPQLGNARYGCVCMVDGAANKLRLYQWGGSGAGTLIKEAAMPTLIPNHDYAIRVDQDGLNATYTLTDQVTQTQSSLRFEWAVDKFETQPFFKGRPGVLFLSGAIVVKTMTIQAKTTKDLKAIIFGDSNQLSLLPASMLFLPIL